jgi:hypothetical protein
MSAFQHEPVNLRDARPSFQDWAAAWYRRLGARPESPEYLEAVSSWRAAWRPSRVRVLLVAESHVAEIPTDQRMCVVSTPWTARAVPDRFVRLVYCLGYGEPQICRPAGVGNRGTPQFWTLLGQIACRGNQPQKGTTSVQTRLRWKVDVLEQLASRGIWLQDACAVGLYLPGGKRIDSDQRRLYPQLLRESYERWVWPTVADDQPSQVWVIGRGVGTALAGFPGIDPAKTIPQPGFDQARHRAAVAKMSETIRESAP